ncbi:hypothetical protein FDECE_11151 [Fusarium decemcellulare]|nr:hypothetical protein FDECE_11151 [Fusarium decemcellulare]
MNQLQDPPDFNRLADGLQIACDHVRRCQSIPAFDNGVAILQAIHELSHKVDTVNQKIDIVDQRLSGKIDTVNNNIVALDARMSRVELRMDALETRMDGFERRMDGLGHQMDGLTRRMDEFDRKFTVSIIRLENRIVIRSDMKISAPRSVHTGLVIPNFPETPKQLNNLRTPALNRLLGELGAAMDGTPSQKKNRLLLLIGVILQSSQDM